MWVTQRSLFCTKPLQWAQWTRLKTEMELLTLMGSKLTLSCLSDLLRNEGEEIIAEIALRANVH